MFTIVTSRSFLKEAAILLMEPAILGMVLPGDMVIEVETINWNDQVGTYNPH
jgi:hypothetical protein